MFDPFADAVAQAGLIRRGEFSPLELLDLTIEHIRRVNPQVNAMIVPLYEKARAEAAAVDRNAPFAGVPWFLKDITLHSKGDPYAAGIRGVKAAGYRSDHDSYFVERMRTAGFVLTGKTNLPEMAHSSTTEPLAWGPTRNPWHLDRTVGGSSGGAAAAVAAGMVAVAHGNDGGGSIRMPAGQCGVVGLKPSRGLISSGPRVPESDCVSGLAVEGFLTRTVRDTAAALDVVSGRRPGDPYHSPKRRPFMEELDADPGRLKIGLLAHDPTGLIKVDPECAMAAQRTARVLSDLGHDVTEGYPKVLDRGPWLEPFFACLAVIMRRELDWLEKEIGRPLSSNEVEADTWEFAERGRAVTGVEYAAGVDALRDHQREIESWWETDGWDLLITPTMPVLTPRIGSIAPSSEDPTASFAAFCHFLNVFNTSGQPAISLPLHWDRDGMPVGVQLAGAHGRDDLLIRVACQLEQAMPWAERRPGGIKW